MNKPCTNPTHGRSAHLVHAHQQKYTVLKPHTFIRASTHAAEAMARALLAFSAAVPPATNGTLDPPAHSTPSLCKAYQSVAMSGRASAAHPLRRKTHGISLQGFQHC